MHRASLMLLFFAGEALAHPDHGSGGWLSATLSHLLSEPDHLAMILAPLAVAIAWIVGRRRKLREARQRNAERYRSSRV